MSLQGMQVLKSDAMRKLAALELLTQSKTLGFSDDVLNLLQRMADGDASAKKMLQNLPILVDIRPLLTMATHIEDRSWQQQALHYCVMRQAHYPLLNQLFGVSRYEVGRVRKEINAPQPPLKAQGISLPELHILWGAWKRIQLEYRREVDQWIAVAEQFPQYSISRLYSALVVEAADFQGRP